MLLFAKSFNIYSTHIFVDPYGLFGLIGKSSVANYDYPYTVADDENIILLQSYLFIAFNKFNVPTTLLS